LGLEDGGGGFGVYFGGVSGVTFFFIGELWVGAFGVCGSIEELADGAELVAEGEADDEGVEEGAVHGGGFEGAEGLFGEGNEVDDGGGVEFLGEGGEGGAGFGGDFEQVCLVTAGDDDHEVAQEFDHFGENLFDAHAVPEKFVGADDGGGGVAVGDGVDELADGGGGGFAEEVFEDFVGDVFFAEGEDAVEDGEGIAHGAVAEAGDAEDGIGFGLDAFIFYDVGEVFGDALGGDVFEIEALAAGDDGGGDFVDVGGGEDEFDVGGRLFEGFEECVEGAGGEHVDFVDDVDFEGGACGADAGGLAEFADLVDGVVGGAVDFDDVHVFAAGDGFAGVAGAAGVAVG